MKLKKLTAMLCSVAMALSVISMPATANTETTEKYLLVNDQFASGDVGGWVQHKHSDTDYGSLTTTDIGDGNYALVYETTSSNWSKDFIKCPMPGGAIQLAGGADIVVETKIKFASQGGSDTRLFFKYNLEDSVVENQNMPEYNLLWGNLFMNQKGDVSLQNGYTYNTTHSYYSYPKGFGGTAANNGNSKIITGATDNWYTYKFVLHGGTAGANHTATGNKVDFYIYDENGTEVVEKFDFDIDFPDNSNWGWEETTKASNINWVEDVINNFAFKTRSCGKLFVDYFKVWQEGVKVTDATATADLRNINVALSGKGTLAEGIADYVTLYEPDGITEATATKTYDVATQTVTFASAEDLTAGAIYKVKFDTTGVTSDMLYTWEAPDELNVEAPACAAINLEIKGVLAPGTNLEADYDLMPEGSVEGASEFIWYTVAPDGSKTPITGETGKVFSITDETYVNSTITYSVKPQCVVDRVPRNGVWTNCTTIVTPLSAPVASNPEFSSVGAMVGESLSALYDYYDADGDVEDGSVITWYKGSAADSDDYTEFATGETIRVTDELNGMYIKFTVVPKNNALYRETGDVLWSAAIGPAADIITASNLFVNADFESGDISPWTASALTGYQGVAITDEEAYNSRYSMRAYPRPTLNPTNGQTVALEAGKIYILSAMVKSASGNPHANFEGQASGGSMYRPYRTSEYTEISPDEWVRVSLTIAVNTSTQYQLGFKSDHDLTADAYVDDAYVGELRIGDIGTKQIAPVTIPKGDEKVSFSVLDGKIYNQLGETDGLTEQTATLSVEGVPGVSIVNDMVVVDSSATAGIVTVKATVVPKFTYNVASNGGAADIRDFTPAQSEFVKEILIELVAHNDKVPVAKNVDATGTVVAGNTLTGTYDFYQVDGKANASTLRWMYCDTQDGSYKPIPGATGMTYVVGSAYADKFIKFEVTPKTNDGLTGTAVSSVVLTTPTAPYAENVAVSGDFKVGGTITGTYKFGDINRDNQLGTTFKWYISDSLNGEYIPVAGETSETLELTTDFVDKYIKFGVTPKSDAEPKVGTEALSDAYIGPVAPVAKDISIKVDGKKLTGQYTYYHEHNARELKSLYKWTVDGQVVSTDSYYIVNFAGTKTVTFTVTPVGNTNPGTGKPVSASVVITGISGDVGGIGSSGGSGGGGGFSSGGGSIASGVGSINNLNYGEQSKTDDTKTDEPVTDLNGHWGADYIKKMEERGVMSSDEKGNYNPDKLVSREEMLTYLFKTLNFEKTDYSGEFSDVADGEFAGILQTMVDNGTISKDTTFRPNDSISREEMCKILYISLENAGKLENVEDGLINSFADFGEISDWAVKYVNAMYGTKMMIGVSDDRFAPKENLTKAQAATLLTRIIALVEGE